MTHSCVALLTTLLLVGISDSTFAYTGIGGFAGDLNSPFQYFRGGRGIALSGPGYSVFANPAGLGSGGNHPFHLDYTFTYRTKDYSGMRNSAAFFPARSIGGFAVQYKELWTFVHMLGLDDYSTQTLRLADKNASFAYGRYLPIPFWHHSIGIGLDIHDEIQFGEDQGNTVSLDAGYLLVAPFGVRLGIVGQNLVSSRSKGTYSSQMQIGIGLAYQRIFGNEIRWFDLEPELTYRRMLTDWGRDWFFISSRFCLLNTFEMATGTGNDFSIYARPQVGIRFLNHFAFRIFVDHSGVYDLYSNEELASTILEFSATNLLNWSRADRTWWSRR